MQKQEIKAQLQPHESEDCSSGQGYRERSRVYNNREVYDGQVMLSSYCV